MEGKLFRQHIRDYTTSPIHRFISKPSRMLLYTHFTLFLLSLYLHIKSNHSSFFKLLQLRHLLYPSSFRLPTFSICNGNLYKLHGKTHGGDFSQRRSRRPVTRHARHYLLCIHSLRPNPQYHSLGSRSTFQTLTDAAYLTIQLGESHYGPNDVGVRVRLSRRASSVYRCAVPELIGRGTVSSDDKWW